MSTARTAPRGGKRTLASEISDSLRLAISRGEYRPGDRLPSEAQLTQAHDVSRTVVREAITLLRAGGLVEARQGSGVYVLPPLTDAPAKRVNQATLSSALEILELRTPVEVEAAGLAALRRSPAQEELLFDRHAAIIALAGDGKPIRDADFNLHLAIAESTNNPQFTTFLVAFGNTAIPSSTLVTANVAEAQISYHGQLINEHEQIVLAISRGDEDAARQAMRAHLEGSQRRHRDILQQGRLAQGLRR